MTEKTEMKEFKNIDEKNYTAEVHDYNSADNVARVDWRMNKESGLLEPFEIVMKKEKLKQGVKIELETVENGWIVKLSTPGKRGSIQVFKADWDLGRYDINQFIKNNTSYEELVRLPFSEHSQENSPIYNKYDFDALSKEFNDLAMAKFLDQKAADKVNPLSAVVEHK